MQLDPDAVDGSLALYEAVRAGGERELARPPSSLWWAGLVADLGYVVGFVIVVIGTLVEAVAVGFLLVHGGLLVPDQLAAVVAVAEHATGGSAAHHLASAVPAGFFIAALVWLSAGEPGNRLPIVVMMIHLKLRRLRARSAEIPAQQRWALNRPRSRSVGGLGLVGTFVGPALVGNIVGGTFLFALLAYAQVRDELDD